MIKTTFKKTDTYLTFKYKAASIKKFKPLDTQKYRIDFGQKPV